MKSPSRVWTLTHKSYGCTKCQQHHFDCDSVYLDHLGFQSKHGTRDATEREHQLHHEFGAKQLTDGQEGTT